MVFNNLLRNQGASKTFEFGNPTLAGRGTQIGTFVNNNFLDINAANRKTNVAINDILSNMGATTRF